MNRDIVLIGTSWPFRGGGIASFNERLARQWMQEGNTVTIYTFTLQYPGFLFPGKSQYSEAPEPSDLDIRIAIHSLNPFNWYKIGREIQKRAPDLVLVRYWLPFFGPCFGTILRLIRRNKKSRIVCIADNIIPHEKRPGDVWFTKYFVKPIDAFITLSRKVASDLKSFSPKPVRVVPHPLYDHFGEKVTRTEALQKLGLGEGNRYLLFVGFIRAYKGLDLLIEAMRLLKEENPVALPELKLLVAGEFYEPEAPYRSQIQAAGLEDNIILYNQFIPDDSLRYYLGAADFVIQPYKHATQSGVTPLAYHFEKPLLVTRVGALPDMIEEDHTGVVTEPTAVAIAAGIKALYSLGEAHFLPELRHSKQKYSWQQLTSAILEISQLT